MDSQDLFGITVGATEVLAAGATLMAVTAGVILMEVMVTPIMAGAMADGDSRITVGDLDLVLSTDTTA